MFREFDERKQELGVLSYGVSLTTLEEVFLRIADEVEEGIESTEVPPTFATLQCPRTVVFEES